MRTPFGEKKTVIVVHQSVELLVVLYRIISGRKQNGAVAPSVCRSSSKRWGFGKLELYSGEWPREQEDSLGSFLSLKWK